MKPEPAASVQLPHLETFCHAAELNSFTGAAKAMSITQAAVSQRIHALEKILSVPLFQRAGGRILVTPQGQSLYSYAQRILELHREARTVVAGQSEPISGELLIGCSSIPGEHFLPALLAVFHQRYPEIRVRASVSDSLQVIEQVENGKAHLGLVGRKVDNPHLEFRKFAKDRLVLVVPSGHEWSGRKQVSLKQLCRQPLILRESGSGLRHCFEKEIERLGQSLGDLQIALELGSNEAIKEAVAQGVGAAVLSIYAVQSEVEAGELIALKLTGVRCDRDMFMVRDTRRVVSAPARVFRFFLESNPIPDPLS